MRLSSTVCLLGIQLVALWTHEVLGRARFIRAADDRRLKGQYIIKLQDTANKADFENLISTIEQDNDDINHPELTAKLNERFDPLMAFSAALSPGELQRVRGLPFVKYIEEDQLLKMNQVVLNHNLDSGVGFNGTKGPGGTPTDQQDLGAPVETLEQLRALPRMSPVAEVWGLDRIGQRGLPYDGRVSFNTNGGAGIDVYVVDTGIDPTHKEFYPGQVQHFFSYYSGLSNDQHGHGTHIAALVGGRTKGVARQAVLKAVKVLGADGLGSITSLLTGLTKVLVDHDNKRRAVVTMSLDGIQSNVLDGMVSQMVDTNMVVVTSAGNTNEDACGYSPAAATTAITVGASTYTDSVAWFSNYGRCVDIFAPGENIHSAWVDNTYIINSGTSMAAPLVAGAAALILGRNYNMPARQVKSEIIRRSTIGVLSKLKSSHTPDRLLFISTNPVPNPILPRPNPISPPAPASRTLTPVPPTPPPPPPVPPPIQPPPSPVPSTLTRFVTVKTTVSLPVATNFVTAIVTVTTTATPIPPPERTKTITSTQIVELQPITVTRTLTQCPAPVTRTVTTRITENVCPATKTPFWQNVGVIPVEVQDDPAVTQTPTPTPTRTIGQSRTSIPPIHVQSLSTIATTIVDTPPPTQTPPAVPHCPLILRLSPPPPPENCKTIIGLPEINLADFPTWEVSTERISEDYTINTAVADSSSILRIIGTRSTSRRASDIEIVLHSISLEPGAYRFFFGARSTVNGDLLRVLVSSENTGQTIPTVTRGGSVVNRTWGLFAYSFRLRERGNINVRIQAGQIQNAIAICSVAIFGCKP